MSARSPSPLDPPLDDGLVSLADVCRCLGRSREWVRRALRDGRFPAPIRMGNRYAWRRSQVLAFLDSLSSASGGAGGGPEHAA